MPSEILQRSLVMAVLLPLILWLCFAHTVLLRVIFVFLLYVCIREICVAMRYGLLEFVILCTGLLLTTTLTFSAVDYDLLPPFMLCFIFCCYQHRFERIAMVLFLYMWIVWQPLKLFLVFSVREDAGLLMIHLVCCVGSADAGAYAIGKLFGRHVLLRSVSPNKTLEGFAGGFCAGTACFITTTYLLGSFAPLSALLFGSLLSLFAILGDLLASSLKRHSALKDFGVIFPGHGGALDRLDSLLFAAPLYYHLLSQM